MPSWLELIPEAERLFGPMPTFDTRPESYRPRNRLVVADQAKVVGGVLLNRNGQPHRIYWRYVRRARRREGVGIALWTLYSRGGRPATLRSRPSPRTHPVANRHAHSTSGSDSCAQQEPIQPRRRAEGLVFTSSVSGRLAAAGPR